jgi:oligoribonuclease
MPRRELRLLWLDLEMTGLDLAKCRIIEAACILTDVHLKQEVVGPCAVIGASEEELMAMDEWCRETHTRNGLWAECLASKTTVEQAEEMILAFLGEQVGEKDMVYLAGNSPHTDRNFIAKEMPRLNARLHYRMVDVTSVKTLAEAWLGVTCKKEVPHRALEDIRESIAELRHYQAHAFRKK